MEPHLDGVKLAFQLLNFAVLIVLLVRFGGKGIREGLRGRHLEIKKQVEEATRLREQAQRRLQEYEARLQGVDKEIADLLAGIRKEAETEKAEILAAAEQAAKRMKREAQGIITQEISRIERELRKEAASLAVEEARARLKTAVTEADRKRLAETFLHRMAENGKAGEARTFHVKDSDWEVDHGA